MDTVKSAIECLDNLVGFNTVASPDVNGSYERDFPAAVDYMKSFILSKVPQNSVEIIEVPEEKGGQLTGRKSLIIKLGPKDQSGLLISGHFDVVPVDEQLPIDPTGQESGKWHADPFTLIEKDGIYYGRGTNDMKGSVACILASVQEWVKESPDIPIVIALTCDEEKGMAAVRQIIELNQDESLFKKPLACIVAEPTVPPVIDAGNGTPGMQVGVGHKGSLTAWFYIDGISVHASRYPHGVSALEYGLRAALNVRNEFNQMVEEIEADPHFEPSKPTMNIGRFTSGVACNVVPAQAVFDIEIRYHPGADTAAYLDRLHKSNAELTRELQEEFAKRGFRSDQPPIRMAPPNGIPAFGLPVDSALYQTVEDMFGADSLLRKSGATEAAFWGNTVDTVIIGAGSMRTAHMANEYISHAQMVEGVKFFSKRAPELYRSLVSRMTPNLGLGNSRASCTPPPP